MCGCASDADDGPEEEKGASFTIGEGAAEATAVEETEDRFGWRAATATEGGCGGPYISVAHDATGRGVC